MEKTSGSPASGYDVVGDVHGCLSALRVLARRLGYTDDFLHPTGRVLVFVGDLADRGSDNVETLRLIGSLVFSGRALLVRGNHEDALLRRLTGETIRMIGGIDKTIAEIEAQPDAWDLKVNLIRLLELAPIILELAGGKLVVVHACVTAPMLKSGLSEDGVRIAMNGIVVGRSPEGNVVRLDWAADYRGTQFVVYGHTPQPKAVIRNRTCNVDTGAYRGNRLTAIRWPEMEIESVPANAE